jgi:hypothetical protein
MHDPGVAGSPGSISRWGRLGFQPCSAAPTVTVSLSNRDGA